MLKSVGCNLTSVVVDADNTDEIVAANPDLALFVASEFTKALDRKILDALYLEALTVSTSNA